MKKLMLLLTILIWILAIGCKKEDAVLEVSGEEKRLTIKVYRSVEKGDNGLFKVYGSVGNGYIPAPGNLTKFSKLSETNVCIIELIVANEKSVQGTLDITCESFMEHTYRIEVYVEGKPRLIMSSGCVEKVHRRNNSTFNMD